LRSCHLCSHLPLSVSWRSQLPWRSPFPRPPHPPSSPFLARYIFLLPLFILPPTTSHLPDSAASPARSQVSPVLDRCSRWSAGGARQQAPPNPRLSASGGRLLWRAPPPATRPLPPWTVLIFLVSLLLPGFLGYVAFSCLDPRCPLVRLLQKWSLSLTSCPASVRSCRTPSCSMISRSNNFSLCSYTPSG
jgi:hypothetical protein